MTLSQDWGTDLDEIRELMRLTEAANEAALQARAAMVRELRESGFTQTETAALMGISNQRVSQIERAGWKGAPTSTAAELLATAREAFQAAKHAQKLREERVALGYKRETAIFYREHDTPVADEQEDRIKWAGWHQSVRAEAS